MAGNWHKTRHYKKGGGLRALRRQARYAATGQYRTDRASLVTGHLFSSGQDTRSQARVKVPSLW